MKRNLFVSTPLTNPRSALIPTLIGCLICTAANSAVVDWAGGQWDNSNDSVSNPNLGWNNRATFGISNIGDGITVNVTSVLSGGATAGTSPANLTVSAALGVTTLLLVQANDSNLPSGVLSNYSTTAFVFNTLVTTPGFSIIDVDRDPALGWTDFIHVKAFAGGAPVTVTYTNFAANQLGTNYGLDGVFGIADSPNTGTTGNVSIAVAGSFDRLELIYTQQSTVVAPGLSHGIGLANIDIIPEPSTALLSGLGVLALLRRRR